METSNPTQTENLPLPQVDVLECISKNMFADIALQSIGLRVLGSVFQEHPELNKPDLYERIDEFNATFNKTWDKFTLQAENAGGYLPPLFLKQYDNLVDTIVQILNHATSDPCVKIVAGTVRLHVELNQYSMLTFMLIWIAKKQ